MKKVLLIFLIIVSFGLNSFAQNYFPINYRVEKQSMSTPMTELEEMFFEGSYYTKPINVRFDGEILHMCYDNNSTYLKKEVTEVLSNADFDDYDLNVKRHFYTFNDNQADTIMLVVDYDVAYLQLVLPTKKSDGGYIGYTSYKKYINKDQLADN